ncbi:hypothetical protein MTO96_017075 [Rhipicephalus appendiculatus]
MSSSSGSVSTGSGTFRGPETCVCGKLDTAQDSIQSTTIVEEVSGLPTVPGIPGWAVRCAAKATEEAAVQTVGQEVAEDVNPLAISSASAAGAGW